MYLQDVDVLVLFSCNEEEGVAHVDVSEEVGVVEDGVEPHRPRVRVQVHVDRLTH